MIYLVSGRAGSGKGTVTSALLDLLPGAKEMSFALPIKQWAVEYFDLQPHECFNSYEEAVRGGFENADPREVYKKTPFSRMILQNIGGMYRDKVAEDYWAERLTIELTDIYDTAIIAKMPIPDFVISDWRYPNELSVVLNYFSVREVMRIRVIRPDLPPIEAGENHHSETSLTDDMQYDIKFYNDGTVEELREQVETWLNKNFH